MLVCWQVEACEYAPVFKITPLLYYADPMEDQFEKLREEKRERVSKNKKQQQRNEDRAAGTIKAGTVDPKAAKLQRKSELSSAIAISKSSTASLGKFDRKLDNEGVVKIRASKRSFDAVSSGDIAKEKEMASKVLKKVVEGSGSIKTGKRAGTTTLQEEERPQKKGRKGVSGGKKRK